MPTADQFRATAGSLEFLGGESGSLRSAIRRVGGDIGVQGDGDAEAIGRGLDTIVLNIDAIVSRCAEEAHEARRRAGICDSYTADIRVFRTRAAAWDRLDPEERLWSRPNKPVRPASWAEEG